MTKKTFPPEVVCSLIAYLKDDKKSLYSCLLVSREWCREAVYLLWRQPFHFLYTCRMPTSSPYTNPELINDCHFSEKKRQSQAANLLMTYYSIKYNDELVKEGIIDTKNWIKWDKSDNKISLLNFLNSKFNLNSIDNLNYYTPLTFKSIFKYFFTYSIELKLFSFDIEFNLRKINNNHQCLTLNGANMRHDNYYHKFMDEFYESNFPEIKQIVIYYMFADYGRAIDEQKYRTLEEAKQLASLIRSQHNLIYFKLFGTHQEGMIEILKSLKETQHNSLKTLIFNFVIIGYNSYVLFYLKYFQNLQELRFINCNYIRDDIDNEQRNYYEEGLCLSNLKFLQVNYHSYKEDSDKLSSILLGCSPLIDQLSL
ncbi:hypothetical protein C1645_873889 [Glomus cerebriforme]|uniref:F-box domain-containing protein n=1 Tax=Glomus cerebriforme TaxID=658196 RepID=A0A397TFY2_9GLOM|nr:hypothetical protein C1645_873889 [Glomus cerebriforme]